MAAVVAGLAAKPPLWDVIPSGAPIRRRDLDAVTDDDAPAEVAVHPGGTSVLPRRALAAAVA